MGKGERNRVWKERRDPRKGGEVEREGGLQKLRNRNVGQREGQRVGWKGNKGRE